LPLPPSLIPGRRENFGEEDWNVARIQGKITSGLKISGFIPIIMNKPEPIFEKIQKS
jgi:hypothetical protein